MARHSLVGRLWRPPVVARAAVVHQRAFLAAGPAGGRFDRFRLLPIRANRQPALAAYLRDGEDGPFHAHGVLVIACRNGAIASLTRFGDTELIVRFGLPMTIDG